MASKQRYILEIKKAFETETKASSDDFVIFFASIVLPQGTRPTSGIIDEFRSYAKSALNDIISDLASKNQLYKIRLKCKYSRKYSRLKL